MMLRPATKLPRCGVQMNTTRATAGSGSTNSPRRSRSRVSSASCSASSGLRVAAVQIRSPLLMTCILTSRPPWLCPIRTIRRRAGSVPSGSSRATAPLSASRRRRADSGMGLPESYWKNQNW